MPKAILAYLQKAGYVDGISKVQLRNSLVHVGFRRERMGPTFAKFYTSLGRLKQREAIIDDHDGIRLNKSKAANP